MPPQDHYDQREALHEARGARPAAPLSSPRARRLHVIPVGDDDVHAAQEICWCCPTKIEPLLWVHNAKDCRESQERAGNENASAGWITIAEYVTED